MLDEWLTNRPEITLIARSSSEEEIKQAIEQDLQFICFKTPQLALMEQQHKIGGFKGLLLVPNEFVELLIVLARTLPGVVTSHALQS
jgi:hypothetical protein